MLNEYHAGLGALIFRFEGTLERYMGDGLMVLFNDPLPCADPAAAGGPDGGGDARVRGRPRRALAAAGHRLGFGHRDRAGLRDARRIGFEGRLDYAAIGTVYNLAARLCAEAGDGEILIDGPVAAEAGALAELEPVGTLALKGFAAPVPAFNVRTMKEIERIFQW